MTADQSKAAGAPALVVSDAPAASDAPAVPKALAVSDALDTFVKPKWRGWLHAGMFPASVAAGIVLICLADSTSARIACAIYSVSAWLLFGVSAVYHRFDWGPRGDAVLRRLDHANIFLIIAGSYTPFTILLLDGGKRDVLLWLVWGGALAGIAFRVFWVGAPRWLYTPCYLALGWAAVFFLPDFLRTGGVAVITLMVIGGLLYSAGGVVYGLKRPNPSPRWFGFHEVFHAFTLGAFIVQYVGVSLIAYSATR
ncbi:hemolysin III family protein [Kitasatospora sp. MAP5-34]|uniref:PAQR family membrane homeostasis protein TrhA n=1 Tax=Kitasatospora sp. MAP5-34 TaxID=3035102 RepID=UPI0024739142|nr:hemolysin III family protein [Kitasatospora sp. MAP5-34]MDH6579094.1 hemolysin III [Kitasatospora sp. MAP5-34]